MANPMRVVQSVFMVIGLLPLLGGAYAAYRMQAFVQSAERGSGTVISLLPSTSDGSTTYRPVVEFLTADGTRVEFASSIGSQPPSHAVGEVVGVYYDAANPQDATIDSFFSLWGGPLIACGFGAAFFGVGAAFVVAGAVKRRRAAQLRQTGIRISTTFQSVGLDTSLTVNGRHPFQIVSQWQDPKTQEVHTFTSDALWFDPTEYIRTKHILVFIERDNPGRYHMDISFLPPAAK